MARCIGTLHRSTSAAVRADGESSPQQGKSRYLELIARWRRLLLAGLSRADFGQIPSRHSGRRQTPAQSSSPTRRGPRVTTFDRSGLAAIGVERAAAISGCDHAREDGAMMRA